MFPPWLSLQQLLCLERAGAHQARTMAEPHEKIVYK